MPSDGDSPAGYAAMGREGWIGLHWPERLGGGGGDPLATLAAEERFGYHWLPLSGYLLSVKTIGNVLLGHAPDELQERLLPEIAAGRVLFCQGFSEPEAGSDLAALRTSARTDGERFVVSGHKIWTSSAQIADWIYLAVRTDAGASRPHRGISVLVADMRSPGIEVREIATVGGGLLCEVFLTDVEVPATQLVGELNGGWRVLMSTLDHERVTSEKVGVVLRVLDDLERGCRLGRRAARAAPAARRGPGGAPARPACGGAARGRAPRGRGSLDGEALDRDAGPPHGRPGCAPAGPERARRKRRRVRGRGSRGRAYEGERGQHRGRRGGGDPAPGDRPTGTRVRGVSTVLERGSAAEARQFADTVATVVARHATPDPWQPGAAASDADPALDRALSEAGWDELGNDDRLLPFVAPAAAALGRGFASLEPVDRLLGGALRTGELARYAVDGGLLVEPRAGRLELARAGRVAARPTRTRSGWRGWRPALHVP